MGGQLDPQATTCALSTGMTTPQDIEQLIARTALRDRGAFAALYDATSAKLFGVCLSVLKDRAEAEDALQDVFLRVWHRADSYAVTGHSPITWLVTVARNLAIDRLRAKGRRAGGVDEMADIADGRPGPEAASIAASESRQIARCLDELPVDRAGAVKGAYLQGMTYEDLAVRHGVPLNTMRTWLRRSLQKLKECLSR